MLLTKPLTVVNRGKINKTMPFSYIVTPSWLLPPPLLQTHKATALIQLLQQCHIKPPTHKNTYTQHTARLHTEVCASKALQVVKFNTYSRVPLQWQLLCLPVLCRRGVLLLRKRERGGEGRYKMFKGLDACKSVAHNTTMIMMMPNAQTGRQLPVSQQQQHNDGFLAKMQMQAVC